MTSRHVSFAAYRYLFLTSALWRSSMCSSLGFSPTLWTQGGWRSSAEKPCKLPDPYRTRTESPQLILSLSPLPLRSTISNKWAPGGEDRTEEHNAGVEAAVLPEQQPHWIRGQVLREGKRKKTLCGTLSSVLLSRTSQMETWEAGSPFSTFPSLD